ncbi:hypothetical protein [Moraxella lacunata]
MGVGTGSARPIKSLHHQGRAQYVPTKPVANIKFVRYTSKCVEYFVG